MRRNVINELIKRFGKIWISNVSNKDILYKKELFNIFRDNGGIYIKFLQSISITKNFMNGWGTPKDYEIFNKVSYEDIDVYRAINRNDFRYIDTTPIAGGSFAQIYKGILNNGEEVVIKVLRPSIVRNLSNDLKQIKRIVRIASLFLNSRLFNINKAFEEFKNTCLLETNYEYEIANIEYFYNLYKNSSSIVIPKVYKDISNRYVIVEEYIEGPTLASVMSNLKADESIEEVVFNITGSNIWKQLSLVGGELLRTGFTEDYIFGDPHPGNLILLSNNKVAYIDFGIVVKRPTSQEAFYLWTKAYNDILMGSEDYSRLLETTLLCFSQDLAIALKKYIPSHDIIRALTNTLSDKTKQTLFANKEASSTLDEGHFLLLIMDYVDLDEMPSIEFDMTNFNLLKAMQVFISTLTTIDKRNNNKKFKNIMLDSMNAALTYCKINGIPHDLKNKTKYTLSDSYELLLDMISSIANKNEFLFEKISERINL